jgi:hypothetical protein
MSDLKPDRQCRDLHKSNLLATSRKIGPVLINGVPWRHCSGRGGAMGVVVVH